MATCHCESGVSPTNQSLFVWHPLHNGAERLPCPFGARKDKYHHNGARMATCHCEEGASPCQ